MRPLLLAGFLVLGTEIAFGTAGPGGVVVVAGMLLAALALSVLLGDGGRTATRTRARGRQRPDPPFRRYEELLGALPTPGSSARQYDLDLRPVLGRILSTGLEYRHGGDRPGRTAPGSAALGDVWPLVDPTVPLRGTDAPAPSLEDLDRVVTALERLTGSSP